MNEFSGKGAPAPPPKHDVFFIDSVGAGRRVKFDCFSPQVWGVWTHYHDKTTPCYRDHNHCAEGHDPTTLRWKGYLFGVNHDRHKKGFIQFTDHCYWQLNELFVSGVTLRGKVLYFTRTAKKNGRLNVSHEEYITRVPEELPEDVDPRKSLYNLWRLPDPGWGWTLAPTLRLTIDQDGKKEEVS